MLVFGLVALLLVESFTEGTSSYKERTDPRVDDNWTDKDLGDVNNDPGIYEGKVVGVLTQATAGSMQRLGDEFVAASYIKFVQSAGLQVIPILTSWKDENIIDILGQINGVLVPGGAEDVPHSRFYEVVKLIYNWAEAYNSNLTEGYFPMWGTCLGLQTILTAAANASIETKCSAEGMGRLGMPNNLTFLEGAQNSRLMIGLPPQVYEALQKNLLVYNYHHFCIPVSCFEKDSKANTRRRRHGHCNGVLSNKFTLLAVDWDTVGYEYTALAQHVKYPYFVSQFHPEKPGFEWAPYLPIPHAMDSIYFMHHLADALAFYAQKNGNTFRDSSNFYKMSIENFDSKYTLRLLGTKLQTCYFFNKEEFNDVFYAF